MLSVSTLVVAIVLVIVVFLFYNQFILKDFDTDAYTVRSNILREYLRRAERNNLIPEQLGYVSQVDNHAYHVTYFNTSTLALVRTDVYDDRLQTFNFQSQDFTLVEQEDSARVFTDLSRNKIAPSNISFHPDDIHKFVAHADDGDVVMTCKDGIFDGTQCVTTPICSEPNTVLPLTEDALNQIVFNRLSARHKELTHNPQHHATLYVRCDENAEPHIEECESGEVFQNGECVFRTEHITANDYGLVTAANIPELMAKNVEFVKKVEKNKDRDLDNLKTYGLDNLKTYGLDNLKTYGLDDRHFEFNKPTTNVRRSTIVPQNTTAQTTRLEVQTTRLEPQTTKPEPQTRVETTDADIIEGSRKEFGTGELGVIEKVSKTLSMNVNIGSQKTKTYAFVNKKVEDKVVVEESYKEPNTKESNRAPKMVIPVNDNLFHNYTPCDEYGIGHTFVDASVSNNQYIECLDNNNLFVHTCHNRLFDGKSYTCDMEDMCADFEDGTGNLINSMGNENITFDTGRTVCRDYKVVQVLECDTENFVDAKKFNHPLNVTLELNLPREIFNETECVPYNFDLVKINNDNFRVHVDNKLKLDFSSMMIGRVSKIRDEESLKRCDKVSSLVTYSRNLGELALDPKNCMGVECVGANSVTVDVFDNTRYNLCDERGTLIEEGLMLKDDEYVDFRNNEIVKREGYAGQCRMKEGENYFDEPFRMVGEISCFYTMPMFEIARDDLI